MLSWLEQYGYKNIIIIDNASDYEPLLEFYKTCPYKIIRMDKNYGHRVFYEHPKFFWKRVFTFYILTDPDLAPVEDCPGDFVEQFIRIMLAHHEYHKTGFSLKIDDLPDDYYLKKEVIQWESKFYEHDIQDPHFNYKIYEAPLDTTFALTSPKIYILGGMYKAVRTGTPYQLRHLPWYITEINQENENYNRTIRSGITNWNGKFSREEIRQMLKL